MRLESSFEPGIGDVCHPVFDDLPAEIREAAEEIIQEGHEAQVRFGMRSMLEMILLWGGESGAAAGEICQFLAYLMKLPGSARSERELAKRLGISKSEVHRRGRKIRRFLGKFEESARKAGQPAL